MTKKQVLKDIVEDLDQSGEDRSEEKKKKKDQKQILNKESIKTQLVCWAHKGTKEAVQKIRDFITQTNDKDLKEWAKIALDEGEYFCYSPNNNKEEKGFQLAQMLLDREDKSYYKMSKINAACLELRKLDVEREVHKKVLKNLKDKKKVEDWKYNFSEDYYLSVRARLEELEEELAYEDAWLKEAEKMVKKTEYKDVSRNFFQSIHEDGEGINFWSDNNGWKDEREEEFLEDEDKI